MADAIGCRKTEFGWLCETPDDLLALAKLERDGLPVFLRMEDALLAPELAAYRALWVSEFIDRTLATFFPLPRRRRD